MAITINGDGTLTGISVGGLPDGIVDTDMLATDAVSAAKLQNTAIVAGDLPSGTVIQVKQTVKTDTATHTSSSSSFSSDVMTVTITPTSTDNKILIIGNFSIGADTSQRCGIRLTNGGSVINGATADAAGNRVRASCASGPTINNNSCIPVSFHFLHSPASTSEQTYGMQMSREGNGDVHINRSHGDTDNNTLYRTASFLTVMEIVD